MVKGTICARTYKEGTMAGKEVEIAGQHVNVNRQTGKALERARGNAVVGQANAAATETTAAYETRLRIDNASDLNARAATHAVLLHNQITQQARGDAGLEASLRMNLEDPFIVGAGILVARYMFR
jgi:hypothetical protein